VEHRVLRGNAVELRQGGAAADRDMRPGPGRALEVAAQDGGPLPRLDLVELDDLTVPTPQHRTPISRVHVAYPVGFVAEHRHQVPLALVIRDDEGNEIVLPVRRPATSSITS
jgi:hypothetical protein